MFKFKKIPTLKSSETKEVTTVQLWYVSWRSRFGEYSDCTKEETEAFITKEDAEQFKASLEAAFLILRHTSKDKVTLFTK